MLRQLARLTRPLPAAGPAALAIAVYADEDERPLAARDKGFEGVACVDDSARAVVLLCDLWERTRLGPLREWALGLLEFVLYQQRADGAFANFVRDWDGTPNLDGPTSYPGGEAWQARGLRAVARAWRVLGVERATHATALALRCVPERTYADVRALHVLVAMELGRDFEAWCDEIASCREGDVLLDDGGQGAPHLWGHLQEGVLARAASALRRKDLLDVAIRSAERVFVPPIESGFDLQMVQPYSVASAIFAMDSLALATDDPRYARLARQARDWFDGRNTAGVPVYDRDRGRVGDGIDRGVVNRASGAESNIVAAQSLLDDVVALVRRDPSACVPAALASLI